MPKRKKEETILDILDRIEEDIEKIRDKMDEDPYYDSEDDSDDEE